jgi:hypothetical protein
MDGCAGLNTPDGVPIRATSRRRLPTAADEADVIIGVRGVLGNFNATPATKNRALGPCRTRAIRPAHDNPNHDYPQQDHRRLVDQPPPRRSPMGK